MSRKEGEIWTNEAGNTCAMLHAESLDVTNYQVTARIDNDGLMLATHPDGRTFLLTRSETMILVKAINKHWPLDALSRI